MNALKKILKKLHISHPVAIPMTKESGQSMVILAFAFMGLLAMLGLALDLGLVYVERVKMKRTVDAASLAAVAELPSEEEAITRAITYLQENGYDMNRANVYVAGCVQDLHNEFSPPHPLASLGVLNPTGGGDPVTRDDLINIPAGDINLLLATETDVLTPTNFANYYHYIRYDGDGDGDFADEEVNFFIDTRSYQDRSDTTSTALCDVGDQLSVDSPNDFGSASKIRVYGQNNIPMNFMQFFNFSEVAVHDQAVAQSSTSLDVSVVLDTTGSMEFDTICYGCWARCGGNSNNTNAPLISTLPSSQHCDSDDKYQPYPQNGRAFPFDYYGSTMQVLREGSYARPSPEILDDKGNSDPNDDDFDDHIIIEAEFYSHNSSNWRPGERTAETGYWALQRLHSIKAYAIDGFGYSGTPSGSGGQRLSGSVRHHPYLNNNSGNPFGRTYSLTDAENNVSPRLEYDFYPTWNGNTYIYVRAQRYDDNNNSLDDFYWAVDSGTPAHAEGGGNGNGYWQGNRGDYWDWEKIGPINVSRNNMHTFKIWAGSVGFAIDRIIITSVNTDMNNDGLRNDPATPGSASQRLAADICNPIYGLTVIRGTCSYLNLTRDTNNLNDPLFGDVDPIRGAQEAIRGFVLRLDPQIDQAGFVDFSSDAGQRAQLECQRASRARQTQAETNESFNTQRANYPLDTADGYPEYDEFACYDPSEAAAGTVPISFTNVLMSIEDANPPSGNTDIADGLRRGLHMLGINTDTDDGTNHANDCDWNHTSSWWRIRRNNGDWLSQPNGMDSKSNPVVSHCSRGQAAQPVLILLTDGAPTNGDPGDNNDCTGWTGDIPYQGFPTTDNKYKCIVYYAEIAAANGVVVYPIGLGVGADRDLLGHVADVTNGQDYYVLSSSQLDLVFDEILANIYIRLIQ